MGSASLITRVCCKAVQSAILATAWLLVFFCIAFFATYLSENPSVATVCKIFHSLLLKSSPSVFAALDSKCIGVTT